MADIDFLENSHTFAESEMKTISPVKPEQMNGYDCGLFLLTYTEKILER